MDINSGITNVAPAPADAKPQASSVAMQEGREIKTDEAVAAKLEVAKQKDKSVEEEIAAKSVSSGELKVSVDKLNNYLKADQRNLAFSVDEGSGRDVVSILDTVSKEVIKQYPTEEILTLSAELNEFNESGSMEQAFNIFTSEA